VRRDPAPTLPAVLASAVGELSRPEGRDVLLWLARRCW